jgi:hypothetical protein
MNAKEAPVKVLLTVLGPLSMEQLNALADMFPRSFMRQASSVFVDGKPRAVFEFVEPIEL